VQPSRSLNISIASSIYFKLVDLFEATLCFRLCYTLSYDWQRWSRV